jgi:tetratricopeptide (TPR) repeat protein
MDLLQRSNLLRRIGDICLEIIEHKNDADVCRRAIDAYEEALLFYAEDRYPAARARTLRGLGCAYASQADFADRQSNLAKAISCWEVALGFFAASSFPEDHAGLQNELCGAYRKLAELERRRDNGKRAVQAALAALSFYSQKDRPLDYAAAKANLAGAYLILAQAAGYAADQADGCQKAIAAYREAMAAYAQDRYPQKYAAMKNNLAIAYLALSQVEDKEDNCLKALLACREGLSYISREQQPLAYAALQNSLGNAYIALAEEAESREDAEIGEMVQGRGEALAHAGEKADGNGKHGKAGSGRDAESGGMEFLEFCRLALEAYSQAARIYSKDENPWNYATAQNNLSSAYLAIGQREDSAANSMKALKAAGQALSFFTLENSLQDYAEAQMNLWMAHLILADIEYREENCSAALEAAGERLKAALEFGQPLQLAGCYKDLAITACMLADLEASPQAKGQDCQKAIDAALEALRIYRVQSNPAEYAETQTLLWAAYSALAEVKEGQENSKRAIYACRAAIRVYDKISPAEKAYAQKNLAHSFIALAEMENRAENCRNAIEACQAALEHYTADRAPREHADILKGLAYAYVSLSRADEEDGKEGLKKALKAYKKALQIYQAAEKEMAERGDTAAHEAREMVEMCQRSLQSCKGMLRARRKAGAGRLQEKQVAGE